MIYNNESTRGIEPETQKLKEAGTYCISDQLAKMKEFASGVIFPEQPSL